jgi:outer membrane protein, heavy metal efflux system
VRSSFMVLGLSACASLQTTSDMARIEATVAQRASQPTLKLPQYESPDEVPEGVEKLLAQPLTAEAAARIAVMANRDARAALAEVGVARGALVQAGLLPNPEVEFEVRAPGGPQPVQVDIGLEVSVSETALAPARAAVAESLLEAEQVRATGFLLDLMWEARVTFLEVQAAQQKLELRTRLLESQQASYATAVVLQKAGNLNALEVAKALAAVEGARVQVAEAEMVLLDEKEKLNRTLGLSGARTGWGFEAVLPLPDTDAVGSDIEARAVSASLELLEMRQRTEASSRKVSLRATEGWLPHLAAGFHGERDGELWELGAHVSVGLPFFDRGQGRQLAAKSEYDAFRSRAESLAIGVRSLARSTLNRVESSKRRALHFAQRILPAKQVQLEQTVLQYNAMQVGVFEVLQMQRGVTEAALMQVDALHEYWRAKASLALLLAGRSTPLRAASPVSMSTSNEPMTGGH